MITKIIKTVRGVSVGALAKKGFTPVELVIMVGFGALAAAALIYLGTTPHYMASSTQPVNVNVKVDGATASRTTAAKASVGVLTVDASGGGDYTTIQKAIDAADEGDKIVVMPGTYEGAEVTKKSLTIIGDDGVQITGFADGKPANVGFVLEGGLGDGSTISQFSFDGVPYPIWGSDTDGVTISHLNIKSCQTGIFNAGGSNWTITHNTISDIKFHVFFGFPVGIQLVGASAPANNNLVAFNDISSNLTGGAGSVAGIFLVTGNLGAANDVKNNKIVHNKVKISGDVFWWSIGLMVWDFSALTQSDYIKDNYIGFNDFSESYLDTSSPQPYGLPIFLFHVSPFAPDNYFSRNLGETWYSFTGPVDYINFSTGESRAFDELEAVLFNPQQP